MSGSLVGLVGWSLKVLGGGRDGSRAGGLVLGRGSVWGAGGSGRIDVGEGAGVVV